MKNGTAIAAIVVIGYVGFEAFAVHKVRYRLEPDYIHNMLIEAKTAVRACQEGSAADSVGFNKALTRVTNRYKNELAEQGPNEGAANIEQVIAAKAAAAETEMEAYIAEKGCDDQEVKNHLRRFDIYARKG